MNKFPRNLLLGFSSSSYQIEGGWKQDGKGENIWDRYCHGSDSKVTNKESGDISCNSYENYSKDVAMIKEMSGQIYRFSLSWTRLLPTGYINSVNQSGIDYYNKLINELISNGIEPMVTLTHWDWPQTLEDLGGWTNEKMVDYFVDLSRLAFTSFGDRVKKWITINEPYETAVLFYGNGIFSSGKKGHGVAEYLAGHNLLKAHAMVYHLYDEQFRSKQGGVVGISLSIPGFEPKTTSPDDIAATRDASEFLLGWFANPIFSTEGDYPEVMKRVIAENSAKEGFLKSRLPSFDEKWISYIRGSADFFGVNHYTSYLVSREKRPGISWESDTAAKKTQPPEWPPTASSWFRVRPAGFRKALQLVKSNYNNPIVYVTENGFSDRGDLEDDNRISYYNSYLHELLKAVNIDGVNVQVYTAWSLLDSFEWLAGYTEVFGIIKVDFNDPERKRTPKKSAHYFKRIYGNRCLDPQAEDQ